MEIVDSNLGLVQILGEPVAPDPLGLDNVPSPYDIQWSYDLRYISTQLGLTGNIEIWDIQSGQVVQQLSGYDVRWSIFDNTFSFISLDLEVQVWSISPFQMLSSTAFDLPSPASILVTNPSGDRYLAHCENGVLQLFNPVSNAYVTHNLNDVDLLCPLDDIKWSVNNLMAIASHQVSYIEEDIGGYLTIFRVVDSVQ